MLIPEKRALPIRLYNLVFNSLGVSHKLDFDQLLKKAFRKTGLKNLGSDFNEEALRNLIKSINSEANLHPFGKLMIREKLISQLENRLWAEYWFEKYPEILEREVLPILLVTGLQRTGTTKMQRLLSSQEGSRALLSWEGLYPAPIGSPDETRKRISRTRRNEKAVKFISPIFHSIHPIYAEQPEEDVLLLDVHFMGTSAEAILNVPDFADWLEAQDNAAAYEYEKKLLKLLQWQRGGDYWVLKSPHHLQYLHEFTRVFPNVKIIWMHRRVKDCIPSFLSMLFYSRAMFTSNVDVEKLKEQWLGKLIRMLDAGTAFKEQHPSQVQDVLFNEFMRDEDQVAEHILGEWGDKAYLKSNNSKKNSYTSNHKYKLEDWGIGESDLRQMFHHYNEILLNLEKKKE